jgi:hypothetical protein
VLGICFSDVEDFAPEREVAPLDAEKDDLPVYARFADYDGYIFLEITIPMIAYIIFPQIVAYLLINVLSDELLIGRHRLSIVLSMLAFALHRYHLLTLWFCLILSLYIDLFLVHHPII